MVACLDEGSNPSGSTFARQSSGLFGATASFFIRPILINLTSTSQASFGGRSPLLIYSMEVWTVYILLGNDQSYYVGCTSNLEARLERHQNGGVDTTKYRLPLKLITTIKFLDKYKAFQFEKYLKTGSGRAFMLKRLV